jgi:hypothetical protein
MSIWNSNKQLYVLPCLLRSAFSEFLDQSKLLFFISFLLPCFLSFFAFLYYTWSCRVMSVASVVDIFGQESRRLLQKRVSVSGIPKWKRTATSWTGCFITLNTKFVGLWYSVLMLLKNDIRARRTFVTRTALFWVITQRIVAIPCRRFGTTIDPIFDGQESFDLWPLKMDPIGCPKTSARNCHYSLHNKAEKCSSHLLIDRNLKSRDLLYVDFELHSDFCHSCFLCFIVKP